MRRNTVRLLKYVIAGALLFVLGPLILRRLLGGGGGASVERFINANAVHNDRDLGSPVVETALEMAGKTDWHDYKAIEEEKLRKGPGEQGQAYILSQDEEKRKGDLFRVNGFNALASDKISLQRALNDIRHPDCQKKKYVRELPTASIILPFHNEHLSTLLRSVYSVLNRAPQHLVKEVILADDFSNKEHCKQPLDDYVREHFSKVRVVRATQA